MPRAVVKQLFKIGAKAARRAPSSASKRLKGMKYKIPATGEFKTVSNVTKDPRSKSIRWLEFDDGMAVKVDASEVSDLTAKFHGAKSVEAKEAAKDKFWRGKQVDQNTQDRLSISEYREHGSLRAAKINLEAHEKQAKQIGVTLPEHVIIEQRGMYKIVPKVRAERQADIGEIRIPKRRGK